jgi:hypothetical protein
MLFFDLDRVIISVEVVFKKDFVPKLKRIHVDTNS